MNNSIELTPAQIDFVKKYDATFSLDDWEINCAGIAGSQRRFIRLKKDTRSLIMVVWDSRDEDWDRFLGIQHDLAPYCQYLPEVYLSDSLHGLILEEDLGASTLKKYIQAQRVRDVEVMYTRVLESLFQWQQLGRSGSSIIMSRSMDYETFLWESWYFGKYCVTDYFAKEELLTSQWERERATLAMEAASLPTVYIHRDFQSENIMIHNNEIRFVDFQGARMGPREYDVASLLYDPYVDLLDSQMRKRLFFTYCTRSVCDYDRSRSLAINAAQRLMQALGAYGNLSLHKGKEWYRNYIPITLLRLEEVLETIPEFTLLYEIVIYCRNTLKK